MGGGRIGEEEAKLDGHHLLRNSPVCNEEIALHFLTLLLLGRSVAYLKDKATMPT